MCAALSLERSSGRCAAARRRVTSMSHRANSAHLGSSLSCIEILDMVYSCADITAENAAAALRDRVVFSKGHAAMAVYATLEQHGLIDPAHLDVYLQPDTALWGHVTRTPHVPALDASTGSLGHGLSLALGFCMAHRLRKRPELSTFCILSDGECDEGSTWEAAMFAGARGFDSLTAIVDYNHIQSLAPTREVMDLEPFADKWRSFGWEACEVNGHDAAALHTELTRSRAGKPRVILAHTVKGKGIPRIENTVASHYKPALACDLTEA
ncbi:MAG: transketolase subunit [Hyphomicrobiales bacterium]|nr:transketolase subunit [Hyphomicrobiales bacterium]